MTTNKRKMDKKQMWQRKNGENSPESGMENREIPWKKMWRAA